MRLAVSVFAALLVVTVSARADDVVSVNEVVLERVNEIRQQNPELREDAFSKNGWLERCQ